MAEFSPVSPILPQEFRAITTHKNQTADEVAVMIPENSTVRRGSIGYTPAGTTPNDIRGKRSSTDVKGEVEPIVDESLVNKQFNFDTLETPTKNQDMNPSIFAFNSPEIEQGNQDSAKDLNSPHRKLVLVKVDSEAKDDLKRTETNALGDYLGKEFLAHPPLLESIFSKGGPLTFGPTQDNLKSNDISIPVPTERPELLIPILKTTSQPKLKNLKPSVKIKEKKQEFSFDPDDRLNYDRPWLSYKFEKKKKVQKEKAIPESVFKKFAKPTLKESDGFYAPTNKNKDENHTPEDFGINLNEVSIENVDKVLSQEDHQKMELTEEVLFMKNSGKID